MSLLDPDILTAIGRAKLGPRRPVEGPVSGQHRSPLHGLSPEFADFRNYAPGDDPRNIDWRVFARSDRYYIRRYEEESNLRAYFVIDSSRSMQYRGTSRRTRRGGQPPRSKYETAATIAVSLGAVSLRQRDAVGLLTADREVSSVLQPSAAGSQLPEIDRRLSELTPDGETDLVAALRPQVDQMARRSLIVVVSDFLTDLDELSALLGQLRYRGHDLLAIQVLDEDEVELPFEGSTLFVDIEGDEEVFAEPWAFREAYRDAMLEYCDRLENDVRAASYDFWSLRCDDDLPTAIASRLHARDAQTARAPG